MKNIEINSVGNFSGGEYDSVEINGVGKCEGSFQARELEVNGVLKCDGTVRADQMEINGTFKCDDRLDAGEADICGAVTVEGSAGIEKLSVDGALTVGPAPREGAPALECSDVECDGAMKVKGAMTAKTVQVDGKLSVEGPSLECDTLECDGTLTVNGQISADSVEVEGIITAQEIVGDRVCITSYAGKGFYFSMNGKRLVDIKFGGFTHGSRRNGAGSQVGLIEATTIELEDVTADTVNGTDVTIGPGCIIEHLDCNGRLSIDPNAMVKNITGDYTMEN